MKTGNFETNLDISMSLPLIKQSGAYDINDETSSLKTESLGSLYGTEEKTISKTSLPGLPEPSSRASPKSNEEKKSEGLVVSKAELPAGVQPKVKEIVSKD